MSEYIVCPYCHNPLSQSEYVKVVRCRDCKYMHTVRDWLGMDVDECWLHADRESGALGKERTEPDSFCAWGERGDGDAR